MAAREAADTGRTKRGGCLGVLLFLVVLAVLGGLGAALFFVVEPQDTSDIRGYAGIGGAGGASRDLAKVLETSVRRGHPVFLKEAEINRYLKNTLVSRQGGRFAPWVGIEGVAVRIEPERVEVVIERSIAGRPFTVSMYASPSLILWFSLRASSVAWRLRQSR
jgi:hypothetical protein